MSLTLKAIQGILEIDTIEDGGQVRIAQLDSPTSKVFFRVISYDENLEHEELKSFEGKMVKMTLEIL